MYGFFAEKNGFVKDFIPTSFFGQFILFYRYIFLLLQKENIYQL